MSTVEQPSCGSKLLAVILALRAYKERRDSKVFKVSKAPKAHSASKVRKASKAYKDLDLPKHKVPKVYRADKEPKVYKAYKADKEPKAYKAHSSYNQQPPQREVLVLRGTTQPQVSHTYTTEPTGLR
jgi:hypothetical protein